MLLNAADLLNRPPGSFAFHIILAITFTLLFSISQLYRSRRPNAVNYRWSLVASGLVILQLALLVLSGLAWAGLLPQSRGVSSFDSYGDAVLAMALAWGLAQPIPTRNWDRLGLALFVMSLIGLVLNLIAFQIFQTGVDETSKLGWAIAGTIVLISIGIYVAIRRGAAWQLSLSGLSLLILGFGGQLLLGAIFGSVVSVVRLAELAALPLFLLASVQWLVRHDTQLVEILGASDIQEPYEPIEGFVELVSADGYDQLARTSVEAVARSLKAEYVSLLSAPDPNGDLTINTTYDLIREMHLPGALLEQSKFPVVHHALISQSSLLLPSDSRAPDMRAIQRIIGLHSSGGLFLLPLVAEEQLYGGLMLLTPYSNRQWTSEEEKFLEFIAKHLGERMSHLNTQSAPPEQTEAQQVDPKVETSENDKFQNIDYKLRQPLAASLTYLDLLESELTDANHEAILSRIRKAVLHISNHIDELSAAKDERSHPNTPILPCLKEAASMASGSLDAKDLKLNFDLPASDPTVRGDRETVTQMIIHLLNNSIGASPQGETIDITVRSTSAGETGFASISITDRGPGILPEDLARVFRPPYPDSDAPIQGTGGSALSLSMVRSIIESIQGRVWVDSQVGLGSTLTIVLPIDSDSHTS
jgi:signal transduction histidine kinase